MAGGDDPGPSGSFEPWELALVRAVARTIRTTERDDLESVLAVHLLGLKARFATTARDWRAFAARALRNKAANWIRDRQLAERKFLALDDLFLDCDEGRPASDAAASVDVATDTREAIRWVWDNLDQDLQEAWTVLVEEDGNQIRAAARLRIHRNTLRLWIRKIRDTLKCHGFGEPP